MDTAVLETGGPTLPGAAQPRTKRLPTALALAGIVILYACVAALLAYLAYHSGHFKDGSDAMFYIYRGEFLYRSITQEGNWFPLIDMAWYNGVQTWRYWSPLSAYLLAGCQAVMGGSSDLGFLLFIALLYFSCAIVWLVIGYTHGRPWLGAVMGLFWFLVPNNLFMTFAEGVLARSISLPAMPIFFVGLYDYLYEGKWSGLPKLIFSFLFIICCHVGWAGMIAISTLFLLFFYLLLLPRDKRVSIWPVIICILLGFLLSGLLLYPSLKGGITGIDSSQVMANHFLPLLDTVNPVPGLFHGVWNRWVWNGNSSYFGFSTLLICILGVLCAKRKSLPGFWTALLILLMTTPTAYTLLSHLPGAQYLWMTRFISIALCVLLVSFFFWLSLRRSIQVAFLLLFAVEICCGITLVTHAESTDPPSKHFRAVEEAALIDRAKVVTQQRCSIVEPGTIVADGIYAQAGFGNDAVPTSYGQGVQAAPRYFNLVRINEAAEDGQYLYVFDRLLEMGNDSVLFPVSATDFTAEAAREMDAAAARSGYALVETNDHIRLYHRDTPATFGVVSTYRAAAIGTGAGDIAKGFPAVEELDDAQLDHYTPEDLEKYDVLYLAGFTYQDLAKAEDLVRTVSQQGTRVLILADGIPDDEHTGSKTFLGVSCNTVNFQNGYPALDTIDGVLYCQLFPEGYTKDWKTVYLNGLTNVWGTITDVPEGKMDFYGTGENENIIYIGLALTYHYSLTQDPVVGQLLSHALDLSPQELPQREIVPLSIDYHHNVITIDSPRDNVNTTLAYHDIFRPDREDVVDNAHLTVVNRGRTTIRLVYPYLAVSAALTGVGLVATAAYLALMKKRLARKKAAAGPAETPPDVPPEAPPEAETGPETPPEAEVEVEVPPDVPPETETPPEAPPQAEAGAPSEAEVTSETEPEAEAEAEAEAGSPTAP